MRCRYQPFPKSPKITIQEHSTLNHKPQPNMPVQKRPLNKKHPTPHSTTIFLKNKKKTQSHCKKDDKGRPRPCTSIQLLNKSYRHQGSLIGLRPVIKTNEGLDECEI